MTQLELAALAELGLPTVVDFEKSRRDVSRAVVLVLKVTLEKAGVRFIAKNGGRARGSAYECLVRDQS